MLLNVSQCLYVYYTLKRYSCVTNWNKNIQLKVNWVHHLSGFVSSRFKIALCNFSPRKKSFTLFSISLSRVLEIKLSSSKSSFLKPFSSRIISFIFSVVFIMFCFILFHHNIRLLYSKTILLCNYSINWYSGKLPVAP